MYVGGKDAIKHVSKRIGHDARFKGKTTVFGMVKRGGKVVAKIVPTPAKSGDILPHVMRRIMPTTTAVFTIR